MDDFTCCSENGVLFKIVYFEHEVVFVSRISCRSIDTMNAPSTPRMNEVHEDIPIVGSPRSLGRADNGKGDGHAATFTYVPIAKITSASIRKAGGPIEIHAVAQSGSVMSTNSRGSYFYATFCEGVCHCAIR